MIENNDLVISQGEKRKEKRVLDNFINTSDISILKSICNEPECFGPLKKKNSGFISREKTFNSCKKSIIKLPVNFSAQSLKMESKKYDIFDALIERK